jgi:RimJ/RimL family protein N-acetyltransferase
MTSVYLRSLECGDLVRTHKWHNDRALYESLIGAFRYASRKAEEEWLRGLLSYSTHRISLAICLTDDSRHIGNIYLSDIDWSARRARVEIFIGDSEFRSKGHGTAALCLLIKHAFKDLGLLRLHLMVLDGNQRAIRLYEKCGFVVEGRLRRHAFKRGKFVDVLVMGLCVGDCRSSESAQDSPAASPSLQQVETHRWEES